MTRPNPSPAQAVRDVLAWRLRPGEPPLEERCALAQEALVTVEVVGVGSYGLLCTPLELEALTVGFAFSEGCLDDATDVASIAIEPSSPWSTSVRLELARPPGHATPRSLIVSSSCGFCGGGRIEAGLTGPAMGSTLRLEGLQLIRVAGDLHQHQAIFQQTGGTHAAGIFDERGALLAVAEDAGRHNALDKAVGKLLLRGSDARGTGLMMSGRISYELVVKAARAGIEVVAGVSAPSALAVEAATLRNITLCGFVRADRATVYTHPNRLLGLPDHASFAAQPHPND